ncbi:HD family phosphohydrolase [Luteitalea sp. TBR-22]|uniref:HDOD domain-containing protein n=1 Tax=Luteitalea sp. TBR-22 TaxID=2802971 RepID=UPI001AFBC0C8|nr:HDOD domain-containing protein [Luteitalea sp. TBR-22]BCS35909.1 HD family phosphohydrolase [Luteitalea sp. TBR-22]
MIDIKALTRAANDIEALPQSVTRLAAITAGEHWTLQEIEEVVRLDQALTLRLLRAANSAASATAVPIVTVRDAVVRLGIRTLLSLATAVGVQKRLKQGVPEFGLSEGELWRHSVAAALAAESAQGFCQATLPVETYAAALLHDVGKLVMARFLDPEVQRVLAEGRERGGLSSLRAETEVLQVHHGELGGLIAQHWSLPDRLVTGIIHHHTPDLAHDIIADAVHVANIAAKQAGTGYAPTDADLQVSPASLERLGMTQEGFGELVAQVRSRLERVLAAYGA